MGVIPPVKGIRGVLSSKGNYLERRRYTNLLNNELCKLCRENAIMYFDVDNHYSDSRGLLDKKYISEVVHINPEHNSYVKKKLCGLIFDNYMY